jgi:hypothetical protein
VAVRGLREVEILLALGALCSCAGSLRETIEMYVEIRDSGVVYVDGALGSDSNLGSPAAPRKTIGAGIELARALGSPRSVHIAEGTYTVDEPITLLEGISLFGGYASRSWARDVGGHPTVIEATETDAVVSAGEGVTAATVLDGLTIRAADLEAGCCVWCTDSAPTIANCTLDAGMASGDAVGMYLKRSTPRIWNTVIDGHPTTGAYTGILCASGSHAMIQNCTLWAGQNTGDAAICASESHCTVDNTIVFTSGSGCGIHLLGASALPVRLWNTDFWCSPGPALIHDGAPCGYAAMIGWLASQGVDQRDNGSANPAFVDTFGRDYHLSVGSPIPGRDLSSQFTTDHDGTPRTVPWSVGAFEKD